MPSAALEPTIQATRNTVAADSQRAEKAARISWFMGRSLDTGMATRIVEPDSPVPATRLRTPIDLGPYILLYEAGRQAVGEVIKTGDQEKLKMLYEMQLTPSIVKSELLGQAGE